MVQKNAQNSSLPKQVIHKVQKALKQKLQAFKKKSTSPHIKFSELCHLFQLPRKFHPILHDLLLEEEAKGELELSGRKIIFQKRCLIEGKFSQHRRGFGFVTPSANQALKEDVFIPAQYTKNAVSGDRVAVFYTQDPKSSKGPEGKIYEIIERAHKDVTGIIIKRADRDHSNYYVYLPALGQKAEAIVQSKRKKLRAGDRITAKVLFWGEGQEPIFCELKKILGHISDPSIDNEIATLEFKIPTQFSKQALQQTTKLPSKVLLKDIQKRKDLRHLTCITIDPDTAKDFDDALSLTRDDKGNYDLGVHIADVSHYIPPGSPLDKEAIKRCNSTYLPGTCIPMLPEKLSNGLCSLKPNVNRLAVSVLVKISKTGKIKNYQIIRSVIKSRKRLTYNEAKQILDGKKPSPFKKLIEEMTELCSLLKKQKAQRGTVDLAIPGSVILVDKKGKPQKIEIVEYDITHQLVEEFMLLANELVATDLSKKGKELSYRIHEEPDRNNLIEFAQIANSFGFSIKDPLDLKEIQKSFVQAQNSPYFSQMAMCFIRCMKLAFYSPDNIGHYGLQLDYYCHFTSPIRRYIDLVVHRILFSAYKEPPDLHHLSQECSDKERVSAKAEMATKTLKILRLLKEKYEEDPYATYNAFVTKVRPQGIFFEVTDYLLEGYLPLSCIDIDYFIFAEKTASLKGRDTHIQVNVGTKLEVFIKDIDLITSQCFWDFYQFTGQIKRKKSKKKYKKKR